MTYELKNVAILNEKGVDVEEAVNRLNNSVLEDKGIL